MRIAIFHNLAPGGAKRVVYEQVRLLSKKNIVELFEISRNEKDFLNFSTLHAKVNKYPFGLDNQLPGFLKKLYSDFRNFYILPVLHKKIAREIDSMKFDVAIIHPDRYTQAPFILKYLKTKSIYYCHEPLRLVYETQFAAPSNLDFFHRIYECLTRKLRKEIDKKNISYANTILSNSNFTRIGVRKLYGLDAFVCYPGVDSSIFKPMKTKKTKIIFIGSPEASNGIDLVTNIPSKYPEIKVVNFFDSGKLNSDKDMAKKYSSAIATLCLAKNEPFGLSAIESMACMTPVIAVNQGGYLETVINGKTGYLIKRDKNELLKKIKYLIKNRKIANKLGGNGRRTAKKEWSWEKHVKILEKYF